MELLSPAGDVEKLKYAYAYGADAAYIGLHQFSLRTRSKNIGLADLKEITHIKGEKKLYGALNSYMNEADIIRLRGQLDSIEQFPFDAFIVSDLGAALTLREHFGDKVQLHLSTQANCLNSSAVKAYKELGFSRIILGREAPLSEIKAIKEINPEVELEVFVHGAMCMAYSGRCFLSAFLADRSANKGDCAHTCRWNYRLLERDIVLEEESRPGQYFPIFEGEDYTTILSSKDLCMIDYLAELKEAKVDSIKIEGRMKSLYYVATVTRAYRKALDHLEGKIGEKEALSYRSELFNISHREYSTGFFFDSENISKPTEKSYIRDYLLVGTVGPKREDGTFELNLKNKIESGTLIEYIGPNTLAIEDSSFTLFNEHKESITEANHHQCVYLKTDKEIGEDYIIRRKM